MPSHLLALGLEGVPAGLDHAHLIDAQRLRHQLGQPSVLFLNDEIIGRGTGADRPGADRPGAGAIDHLREQGDQIAVAHGRRHPPEQ
jgi:hypothetical protein